MTIVRDSEDIANSVVQLRFADDAGKVRELNAHELAESLQGLVELTNELSKAGEFGDGPPPEVRVRVPKEGSFVLEAILWIENNPIATAGVGLASVAAMATAKETGKLIATAISAGIRKLRSEQPADFEHLESGDVKVQWTDGTVSELRRETWDKLNNMRRPTRRALRKLLTPLNNSADQLEIRDASIDAKTDAILSTPADAVANRTDYLTSTQDPDDSYEDERIFETEAMLGSVDFDPTQKWRVVTTSEGTRKATIEDREFLHRLDHGEPIHKNDIFWIKVRENVTKEKGRNAVKEWAVIEVERTKRGDPDDDASSSNAADDA